MKHTNTVCENALASSATRSTQVPDGTTAMFHVTCARTGTRGRHAAAGRTKYCLCETPPLRGSSLETQRPAPPPPPWTRPDCCVRRSKVATSTANHRVKVSEERS